MIPEGAGDFIPRGYKIIAAACGHEHGRLQHIADRGAAVLQRAFAAYAYGTPGKSRVLRMSSTAMTNQCVSRTPALTNAGPRSIRPPGLILPGKRSREQD